MGVSAGDVILALSVAIAIISLFIAAYVLDRYRKTKHLHLLLWFFAWLIVGIRSFAEAYLSMDLDNLQLLFFSDILTITHSMLWFVGLAYLLDLSENVKIIFPQIYTAFHVGLLSYFYLDVGNRTAGAVVSYGIFIPIILFIIGLLFYKPAAEKKRMGMSLVSGGFMMWAVVYMAFGLPAFIYKNMTLGAIGMILSLIVRAMVFVGFVRMVKEVEGVEEEIISS